MAKTPAGASAVFRAAFIILTLALIFLIVGFVTPNWTEVTLGDLLISRTGLWKTCMEVVGAGENCGVSIYDGEGWYVAVQTFEALGLACFILVLIMSVVLLVAVSNQRLARVNIYTSVFAGIFIIAGTATHTYKTELKYIGYSCWMSWLSAVALVVAIILLECARKKSYRRQMSLTHADVISAESQGYHSFPMQELSPKSKRANQPLVVHNSDHHNQAHAGSPKLSEKSAVS
ncbi:uncharacterized protein LOC123556577 [Mercenaria mercenaria]|uniref:uncharacterized protein LOC123556577 n=1 Tax=Mercenaria mercenaria TaxID=6596 RepID=UPI00234F5467|nr:uncharacterized protein LOC123556577 [Mercenaria mercenaria]